MTNRDPHSRLEDEGIPDLQDDYPEREWSQDPQEAPLPGDEPVAIDDYGTTAEERRAGEPLDERLHREEPDPALEVDQPGPPATGEDGEEPRRSGRLVQDDEGVRGDTEQDMIADEVGPDAGGFSAEEQAVRVEDEGDGII
jgi:hypothetical protein